MNEVNLELILPQLAMITSMVTCQDLYPFGDTGALCFILYGASTPLHTLAIPWFSVGEAFIQFYVFLFVFCFKILLEFHYLYHSYFLPSLLFFF